MSEGLVLLPCWRHNADDLQRQNACSLLALMLPCWLHYTDDSQPDDKAAGLARCNRAHLRQTTARTDAATTLYYKVCNVLKLENVEVLTLNIDPKK